MCGQERELLEIFIQVVVESSGCLAQGFIALRLKLEMSREEWGRSFGAVFPSSELSLWSLLPRSVRPDADFFAL